MAMMSPVITEETINEHCLLMANLSISIKQHVNERDIENYDELVELPEEFLTIQELNAPFSFRLTYFNTCLEKFEEFYSKINELTCE